MSNTEGRCASTVGIGYEWGCVYFWEEQWWCANKDHWHNVKHTFPSNRGHNSFFETVLYKESSPIIRGPIVVLWINNTAYKVRSGTSCISVHFYALLSCWIFLHEQNLPHLTFSVSFYENVSIDINWVNMSILRSFPQCCWNRNDYFVWRWWMKFRWQSLMSWLSKKTGRGVTFVFNQWSC